MAEERGAAGGEQDEIQTDEYKTSRRGAIQGEDGPRRAACQGRMYLYISICACIGLCVLSIRMGAYM